MEGGRSQQPPDHVGVGPGDALDPMEARVLPQHGLSGLDGRLDVVLLPVHHEERPSAQAAGEAQPGEGDQRFLEGAVGGGENGRYPSAFDDPERVVVVGVRAHLSPTDTGEELVVGERQHHLPAEALPRLVAPGREGFVDLGHPPFEEDEEAAGDMDDPFAMMAGMAQERKRTKTNEKLTKIMANI